MFLVLHLKLEFLFPEELSVTQWHSCQRGTELSNTPKVSKIVKK